MEKRRKCIFVTETFCQMNEKKNNLWNERKPYANRFIGLRWKSIIQVATYEINALNTPFESHYRNKNDKNKFFPQNFILWDLISVDSNWL